jgi:hypothetical protein
MVWVLVSLCVVALVRPRLRAPQRVLRELHRVTFQCALPHLPQQLCAPIEAKGISRADGAYRVVRTTVSLRRMRVAILSCVDWNEL